MLGEAWQPQQNPLLCIQTRDKYGNPLVFGGDLVQASLQGPVANQDSKPSCEDIKYSTLEFKLDVIDHQNGKYGITVDVPLIITQIRSSSITAPKVEQPGNLYEEKMLLNSSSEKDTQAELLFELQLHIRLNELGDIKYSPFNCMVSSGVSTGTGRKNAKNTTDTSSEKQETISMHTTPDFQLHQKGAVNQLTRLNKELATRMRAEEVFILSTSSVLTQY